MALKKWHTVLVLILVLMIAGCTSHQEKPEPQKMVIYKRVESKNKYDHVKTITKMETVTAAKELFTNTAGENAKASMARPEDYRISFENVNEESNEKEMHYRVWLTPHKDRAEFIEYKSRYAKMTKQDSAALFKIINEKDH